AQIISATAFFRDRDLFIHDGSKLRRLRVSGPVQAGFFLILMMLVAWASYATARLVTRPAGVSSLTASVEARARQIEQRQALIEAALSGDRVDSALLAQAASSGRVANNGPLARVEQAQLAHAPLVARALDLRHPATAAQPKKLGLTPAQVGAGVRAPLASAGNAPFTQP